jgi:holo-[acyl-carrier protein] synthase
VIFGIGIDLVEVRRIRESFQKFGARFQQRVFTPDEITFCETLSDKYLSYAARFAAKEAFSKALGTGLRGAIGWTEIQVNDNERTRPTMTVFGAARRLLGDRRISVSLSHVRDYATAMVVIETAGMSDRSDSSDESEIPTVQTP